MGLFSTQTVILFVLLTQILISSGHFGKKCTASSQCISFGGHTDICLEGQCACQGWSEWDPNVSECRTHVSYFCNPDSVGRKCVQNSECIQSAGNNLGICTCKAGFSKLPDGLCGTDSGRNFSLGGIYIRSSTTTTTAKTTAKSDEDDYDDSAERETLISSADKIVGHYKKPCNLDSECFNMEMVLECENHACSCYEHDIYDKNLKKCVATAGKACFLPKNPCVDNATCKILPTLAHLSMGLCDCDSGFEISSDGNKCVLITENSKQNRTQKNPVMNTLPENSFGFYGKNCSSNEDCENPNILLCQENKCSCPSNSSFWDQNGEICRSTVGHFCSDEIPCVENAVCYNAICLCDNGYTSHQFRSHQGTCVLIENLIREHNTGKFSSNYLGYLGWILAAIFSILFFMLTAYLGFKKWKNSRPSWPISYKNHKNEGTTNIQIQLIE